MDKKKLRNGFTTGSCATAAAKAATIFALSGITPTEVNVHTPKGVNLTIKIHSHVQRENSYICVVQKDSGDDPDVTNGILVHAMVTLDKSRQDILIEGGIGVGRVTKSGLACEVGQAAINPVPREMITSHVKNVLDEAE